MTEAAPTTISVTRRFRQSAEQVFDAWLDPAIASRFLFATADGEMRVVDIDARVAGSYCIIERRGGRTPSTWASTWRSSGRHAWCSPSASTATTLPATASALPSPRWPKAANCCWSTRCGPPGRTTPPPPATAGT